MNAVDWLNLVDDFNFEDHPELHLSEKLIKLDKHIQALTGIAVDSHFLSKGKREVFSITSIFRLSLLRVEHEDYY